MADRALGIGPHDYRLLDQWGRQLREAFPETPCLVGSVHGGGPFRDVDVRMLCDRLFVIEDDVRRSVLNLSITLWGRQVTGLPIDFQFQGPAEFHQYDGQRRSALGIRSSIEGHVTTTETIPSHRGGLCSRPECPCHTPGPVCDEFLGMPDSGDEEDPDGIWCPRCGWSEAAHAASSPAPSPETEGGAK